MAAVVGAPSQLKQRSRKGKKAWRKNIDISGIQDGLAQNRDEVISHGAPLSTIPSTTLFTTDVTSSPALLAQSLKRHAPLKCDEILSLRSAVPALSSRVPSSKAPSRHRLSRAQRTHLVALADGAASQPGALTTTANESATHDVWDASLDPVATGAEDPQFDFLPAAAAVKAPGTLSRPAETQTFDGGAVAVVRRPGQAKSYNPLFSAWSADLARQGEKEVEAEIQRRKSAKEQAELDAKRAVVLEKGQGRMKGEFRLDEHSSDEEISEWEGIVSGAEDADEGARRKMPGRKTQAQRNRIQRRKEAEREQTVKREAARRRREQAEALQAPKGKSEAVVAVKQDAEMALPSLDTGKVQEQEDDDGDEPKLRRKTLGKAPHPQAPLELVLPDELQDSLRLLKPEGDLMGERYRSLLLRGKIESRRPIGQVRKKRMKAVEKWSYKDWRLD